LNNKDSNQSNIYQARLMPLTGWLVDQHDSFDCRCLINDRVSAEFSLKSNTFYDEDDDDSDNERHFEAFQE
jgi:hypothetical protein